VFEIFFKKRFLEIILLSLFRFKSIKFVNLKMNNNYQKQLSLDLFKFGCIKFENVMLKSGILSPVYIDLRVLISLPQTIKNISELFKNELLNKIDYDLICGVPYTAIPFAVLLSTILNVPMLMIRAEKKNHGTKKLIEGCFVEGQKVLIIEDVISSGNYILLS
jgi:uridine monophosphate synthetase